MIIDNVPEVNKTTFGKEDDVAARWHRKAINLGFNIDCMFSIGLQPRNIDLDIEVSDARTAVKYDPITK